MARKEPQGEAGYWYRLGKAAGVEEAKYKALVEVARDLEIYLADRAESLPQGKQGLFSQREPRALFSRIRDALRQLEEPCLRA